MEQVDAAIQMLALASRMEEEGQYNLAKLLRAAADGSLRRAAYMHRPAADQAGLIREVQDVIQAVAALDVDPQLVAALQRAADSMAQGRLSLIEDAPHPCVCRTCGQILLCEPDVPCPTCGASPVTFQQFPPMYWLDALDPFQAMALLRQTPVQVVALLEGLSEAALERRPADGGWAIRHVLTHLRDAQLLLGFRIPLMLAEDVPSLEAKAVFEWATQEGGHPLSVQEIFDTYYASRRSTLASLEGIPLADWWRTGRHQEFGVVTILQQASYFAMHEVTHLPQLDKLKRSNV